jgi:predicted nucleotidyltransferase
MAGSEGFEPIAQTVKRAVAALREAGVDFALAGSLASWARGGPESDHDLDFVIRPAEVARAISALEQAGMRREDPPEEWLVKAWDDNGVLVDLIFGPSGVDPDRVLEHAENLNVLSMEIPVMALEDLIVTKVMSLTEQELDYWTLVRMARALREQIDWEAVRRRTGGSPFAEPYLLLLDRLGVVEGSEPAPADGGRMRVEVTKASEGS